MDELTPTNQTTKLRYAPTPKLSERKKRLFDLDDDDSKSASAFRSLTITEEEDSDLGPMNPLEFSSSPTNFNKIMGNTTKDYIVDKKHTPRTDFLNVLGPTNSPKTPINRRESSNESGNKSNNDCTSSNKKITVNINGVEYKMRDCVVMLEKENFAEQMKTPNELGSTTKSSDPIHRGRKSLIFDSGLTPSDTNVIPASKLTDTNQTLTNHEHPKAKTSLSFSEPLFSAKSFYGLQSSPTVSTLQKNNVLPLKTYSIVASALTKKAAKRKSNQSRGPLLWRHGGKVHKIRKQIKKPVKKIHNQPDDRNIFKKIEQCPIKSVATKEINIERNEQIHRIQNIFKTSREAAKKASRLINWNTASTSRSEREVERDDYEDSLSHSDDEDDDEDKVDQRVETNTAEVCESENTLKPRKFFKSSSNNVKSYRIIDGIRATMKRGYDLKLERPVKRIKKRKNVEQVKLNTEITGIIDRLSSPQKEKDSSMPLTSEKPADDEKYRNMLPYDTSDVSKINQQISILDLLISHGICNDETFKIFIAEPDLHKEKASKILDSLTVCVTGGVSEDICDGMDESLLPLTSSVQCDIDLPNGTAVVASNDVYLDDVPMSPASQISNMTSSLAIDCASEQNDAADKIEKLFPIFSKDAVKRVEENKAIFEGVTPSTIKWRGTGLNQLQIDAGQKAFGLKVCPQCEMSYNVHEPEDEIIHSRYHNAINTLAFKGWTEERIITELPEWGLRGRIILIGEKDSKVKKKRVLDVLAVVDKDLGFSTQALPDKSLVYLGVAKNQIIGVCVVQPLNEANRYVYENGLDCCTKEVFPVKCGILRIWVAPPFRNFGVARSMITTVRNSFVFGTSLSLDDIAFSSPTEAGKRLAAKLTGRNDFLVYER